MLTPKLEERNCCCRSVGRGQGRRGSLSPLPSGNYWRASVFNQLSPHGPSSQPPLAKLLHLSTSTQPPFFLKNLPLSLSSDPPSKTPLGKMEKRAKEQLLT